MIEFESRRRPEPQINLSAMIDIAFILVIFIVLGATFQRVRGLDIELPNADAEAEPEPEALVVTIPERGPVRVGDREVAVERIAEALRAAREHHTSVMLMADRQAAVERAVDLLAQARKAGFESVAIATHPRGGDDQ